MTWNVGRFEEAEVVLGRPWGFADRCILHLVRLSLWGVQILLGRSFYINSL